MADPVPVHVRVLGPLTVEVAGIPVPIAGKLKHRLISRLALRPGHAVSADALIDALWGEEPPRTAKQSLHVHISHIRDRLRTVGAERLVSTTVDGMYLLAADGVTTDATLFESLIDHGMAARLALNLRSARDQLRDAIEMWGEPFESLANDYGAMAQRQRLVAIHERGLDAYTETLIDVDELDEALALLRAAVSTSPLREHPYEQLMRVFLDRGERASALEVFEQAAKVFDQQLGIQPSDELHRLRGAASAATRTITAVSAPEPRALRREPRGDAASLLVWHPELEIDLTQSALFTIGSGVDTTSFVDAVRAAAGLTSRRVAYGRILDGTASPLSPIFELAGFDAEPGVARSPQLRAQLFDRIAFQLVQQHFLAPIVLLEGFENASPTLLDFLAHALGRPGPAPFTVLLLCDRSAQVELPDSLASLITQQDALDLPSARVAELVGATFDADELSVLRLLSCASLPAPTELIARSCNRGPVQVATAIDRLIARRVLTADVDGRLGLHHVETMIERLALSDADRAQAHLALADAMRQAGTQRDAQRVVARTHHLMHALAAKPWAEISDELQISVTYLESLGAYEDIVALCMTGGDPHDWPPSEDTLPLLVALGRAQMRTGRTDIGRRTLEHCLDRARRGGHKELFAEALCALLEERSPQAMDVASRSLIEEALDGLPPCPSESRVQLLTDLANSWYLSDLDESQRWADQALDLARQGAPSILARALTGVIQAKLLAGNAAVRLDLAVEAQHWARRADSIETLVLALTYEAHALMELGELRRADPPLRYAAALAAEVQVPRFRWWAAAWTALLDFALGDLAAAEKGFMAAYELWPSSTSFDPFECLASQLAALRFVQGRGAELLPVLADLAGPDARAEYLAPASLAFAQSGDVDRTHEILGRMLGPDGMRNRHDTVRPFALALAAESAFEVGAAEHGEALAAMLAPLAEGHTTLNVWGGGGFYWGSLRHGYGLALSLAGRVDDARRELDRAAVEQTAAGAVRFAHRSIQALRSLER